MIHYASLDTLPENFQVPEQFKDRFWYDDQKKRLAYDGVMYKLTFDKIQALHSGYDYQRAVEELFRSAVPDEAHPPQGSHLLAVVSGVVVALALFTAGMVAWQRMHPGEASPPEQPTITNDLVEN